MLLPHRWSYFVGQVRSQLRREADTLVGLHGAGLGVSSDDVLWGLGQLQSRKFSVEGQVSGRDAGCGGVSHDGSVTHLMYSDVGS
ncbi:MAG: hypothetical protein WDW36_008291 [Sanguina aurantia]